MDEASLRALCFDETIMITAHCMRRIVERGLSYGQVKDAIRNGRIIEDYPNDYPYPSCLILGEGIHVVAGIGEGKLWLITAYRPDPTEWEDDMATRRKKENDVL